MSAADEIVRQRLDLLCTSRRAVGELSGLPLRYGLQDPNAPAAGDLAGYLGRAQDGGGAGPAHEGPVRLPLGRPADAARVEEVGLGTVEAPEVVGPVVAEVAEDLRPLDEERPLLLEEGLEIAEVHYRGVDLDLPKVGVDGGVERKVAGEAVLHIESGGPEHPRAVVEGVTDGGAHELAAGHRVGKQGEVAARVKAVEAGEVGHPGGEPALLLGDELQPVALVLALDVALGVDAPGLAFGRPEAELGERDTELGRPPLVVEGHGRGPDPVPGAVVPGVVEDRRVTLHVARAHLEHDAGQVIVSRVQVDPDPVRVGRPVPARQTAHNALRLAVPHPGADVECLVVVGDAQLRGLGGRLALVRVPLAKVHGGRRRAPGRIVQPPVDDDGR